MTVIVLAAAESDLEDAYNYYRGHNPTLGDDLLYEFRRGIRAVLEHPRAWPALDARYRKYRLHRFPYGVFYRVDSNADEIVVVAVSHLSRKPGWWSDRER